MKVEEVGTYLEAQGLSETNIDAVLKHFGVKGQKWGVRNNKPNLYTKTGRKQNVVNQVVKTNKTQRRVATGAAFIASDIGARVLAKKFGLNKKFVYSAVAAGTLTTNALMRQHGALKLADLQL